MSGIGSARTLKSQIFEILVGPSAEPFHVHADVLSRSEVLRKTVEGSFKENRERKIDWAHWTVSAAQGLLEWLYTGDYHCPYPIPAFSPTKAAVAEDEHHAAAESRTPEDGEVADGGKKGSIAKPPNEPSVKKQKTSGAAAATTLCPLKDIESNGRPLQKLSHAEEFEKWAGHQLWTPDMLDYKATFMKHAELYVMGCHYMLDDLTDMAWQRLRAVLMTIGRPSAGSLVVENIITLVPYVYQETGQTEDREERLRNLLATFVALHYPSFKGSAIDTLTISGEEGDREFTTDVMNKLMLRVEKLEELAATPAAASSETKPPPAKVTMATATAPTRHEVKCPNCDWQQTHECGPKCTGYVGAPASSFNARFLNSQGYKK
ncbi:MAG: hypothetical protein Q9166_000657 [cf. Caloplaca sp. 2 TL-2023]